MDRNGKNGSKKNGKENETSEINLNFDFGLGKVFGGLKNIINVLSELDGNEVKKEGNAADSSGKIKGVYGFSVKSIGSSTSIEQFGNKIKKDDKDGEIIIEAVREPIVDIFDEGGFFMVVAEMPGINEEDIQVNINGDILQIKAKSAVREYEKEVLLTCSVDPKPEKNSYVNRVLELKLMKIV